MKVWTDLQKGASTEVDSSSTKIDFFRLIDRNLRVRETHYFLLAFAYLGRVIDIFLAAYALYYILHTILVGAIYCARGKKVRNIWLKDAHGGRKYADR